MARHLAIVGLGPWGLCVLDRIFSRVQKDEVGPVLVHIVEPNKPGEGVYDSDLPNYLLMNTPCDQVSMFAGDVLDGRQREPAPSLYEWADLQGYRWTHGICRVSPTGRRISPDDFLPRCVAGRYLSWYYAYLLQHTPSNLEVELHRARAIGIRPTSSGEAVLLDDGHQLEVAHAFITTGHTPNRRTPSPNVSKPTTAREAEIPAYPVEHYATDTVPEETVAVSGMGLAALDVVAALTLGRGGRFRGEQGDDLTYMPSGREPTIHLYSRSGLPYLSRPAASTDLTGSYEPCICTGARVSEILQARSAGSGLDVRRDLLPLVFAEMRVAFFSAKARMEEGTAGAEEVRRRLGEAWRRGRFHKVVVECEAEFGTFDAERQFFAPLPARFASGHEYQSAVINLIEEDLSYAKGKGSGRPVKEAYEMFRVLRGAIRQVVDFYQLSPHSHEEFRRHIAPRINRLVVGPPAHRSEQLLALMRAGVVRTVLGPDPEIRAAGEDGLVRVDSRNLDEQTTIHATRLIQGYVEEPAVDRSCSPLLTSLFREGRISHQKGLRTRIGQVALTRDLHPVNREGRTEERLWLLGPPTEGAMYFTHYIPSPRSRLQAFRDADRCVATALSSSVTRTRQTQLRS